MKRSDALGLMKAAGYHGDKATWTTLLVEQRVARAKAEEAFRLGAKAKVAGVPCHCRECAEAEPAGESRLPVKGERVEYRAGFESPVYRGTATGERCADGPACTAVHVLADGREPIDIHHIPADYFKPGEAHARWARVVAR